MGAKQRETKHVLEDGFIVAWDSSDADEDVREELAELIDEELLAISAEIRYGATGEKPDAAVNAEERTAA
jgi:hypothetical protein